MLSLGVLWGQELLGGCCGLRLGASRGGGYEGVGATRDGCYQGCVLPGVECYQEWVLPGMGASR